MSVLMVLMSLSIGHIETGKADPPQGTPSSPALTFMTICHRPTPEQIRAEAEASRNPQGLLREYVQCLQTSLQRNQQMIEEFRDECGVDMTCLERRIQAQSGDIRAGLGSLIRSTPISFREGIRTSCPEIFQSHTTISELMAGADCVVRLVPRRARNSSARLGEAITRARLLRSYCDSEGRSTPVMPWPSGLSMLPNEPALRAGDAQIQGWQAQYNEFILRLNTANAEWMEQERSTPRPAETRCSQIGVTGLDGIRNDQLDLQQNEARASRRAEEVGSTVGSHQGQVAPQVAVQAAALPLAQASTQTARQATTQTPAQSRNAPMSRSDLERTLSGLWANVDLNCRDRSVTDDRGATGSGNDSVPQMVHLLNESRRHLDSAGMRIESARFYAMASAMSYVGLISRESGISETDYVGQLDALVQACPKTIQNESIYESLQQMREAGLTQFRLDKNTRVSPPNAPSGESLNVSEANQAIHRELLTQASRELLALNREIATLGMDFTQSPQQLGDIFARWIQERASSVVGRDAGQYAPPICRSVGDFASPGFQAMWIAEHAAPCSGWRLPGPLASAGSAQTTQGEWTAADQLLSQYPIPELNGDGSPRLNPDGTAIISPRAVVRRQESAESRCQMKKLALEGAMRRHHEFLGQFKVLGEAVDPSGIGVTTGGVPLYEVLGHASESSREGILDRALNRSSNRPRIGHILDHIRSICQNPLAAGNELFANPEAAQQFLNCSTQVPQDASPAWRPVFESQAQACRDVQTSRSQACNAMRDAHHAGFALRLLTHLIEGGAGAVNVGMDVMACSAVFTGIGGAVGTMARTAVTEGATAVLSLAGRTMLRSASPSLLVRGALNSVFNRYTVYFAAHGSYELFRHRSQLQTEEMNYWAGIGDGARRQMLREATRGDVRHLIQNLTVGAVLAHAYGGGFIRDAAHGGPPTARAQSEGAYNSPEINSLYEKVTGRTVLGQEGRAAPPGERSGLLATLRNSLALRLAQRLGIPFPQAQEVVAGMPEPELLQGIRRDSNPHDERFNSLGSPEIEQLYLLATGKELSGESTGQAEGPSARDPYRTLPRPQRVIARNAARDGFLRAVRAEIGRRVGLSEADREVYLNHLNFEGARELVAKNRSLHEIIAQNERLARLSRVSQDPRMVDERIALRELVAELYQRFATRGRTFDSIRSKIREFFELRRRRRGCVQS